jgi:hypothetical protein
MPAVPLGAAFSSKDKMSGAFKVAFLLNILVLLMLLLVPIDDTLGIISPSYSPSAPLPSPDATVIPTSESDHQSINDHAAVQQPSLGNPRHLPRDMAQFLAEHLPLSWKTIELCRGTRQPWDWVGNLLVHSSIKTLRLLIVQYLFVICDFGPLVVGGCSIFLGLISFVTLPLLLSRYTSESLIGITLLGSSIGFLLLSAAGPLSLDLSSPHFSRW